MKTIVLIHGYSAESKGTNKSDIVAIYGQLSKTLRETYGAASVVEIDLSRYLSLKDGITLDDIARGFDRLLHDKFSHLLKSGFHAIVHSTGALVIRNWLLHFSKRPSPLNNLIHLAGANFGSGWAHIGKGQLAKWGRMVFQGNERGVQILSALELGSESTIDMHLQFLEPDNSLPEKFGVFEHVITGSQADASWFTSPIRYAKEDGSDGVVRVSAGNLNFNYVRFGPTEEAKSLSWKEAVKELNRDRQLKTTSRKPYYEPVAASRAGENRRPRIPFAIPYECAHTGDKIGIVAVRQPGDQVMQLIDLGLKTTAANWAGRVAKFDQETQNTYQQALTGQAPRGFLGRLLSEPREQYDKHSQIIVRIRDQDGHPVKHYDIFFNSKRNGEPISGLIEDKHINQVSPNVMTFYLRTDAFDSGTKTWRPHIPNVKGFFLEVTATEPETGEILYLPFRREFNTADLEDFIQPHRTTIIDIDLLRLPSPEVYRLVKL